MKDKWRQDVKADVPVKEYLHVAITLTQESLKIWWKFSCTIKSDTNSQIKIQRPKNNKEGIKEIQTSKFLEGHEKCDHQSVKLIVN